MHHQRSVRSRSRRRGRHANQPQTGAQRQDKSDGSGRCFRRGNLQNDHDANGVPQFLGDPPSSVTLANNKGYAAGYTWLISPSLISNFRYGYTRQGGESTGIQSAPAVTLRDIDSRYALSRGISQILPVHTIADDLTWNKGAQQRRLRRIDFPDQ